MQWNKTKVFSRTNKRQDSFIFEWIGDVLNVTYSCIK